MKMLNNSKIIAITLSVVAALPAHGEDLFSTLAIKLASTNQSAVVSEKVLAAEQASLRAAVQPNDPEVTFDYLWPGDKSESNRWSAGISQELPNFAQMSATSKVVKAMDSQKELESRAIYRTQLYEASKILIEYISAKKDVELEHRIHENFDSLTSSYGKAWERGEVSILDVNKVKIEHARAYASTHEAESRLAAAATQIESISKGSITDAELNALTNYPTFTLTIGNSCNQSSDNHCHTTADISKVTDEEMEQLVLNSPQYLALQGKLDVAEEKINLASKSRFPRLSLGYNHAYEDGIHFNGVSAGLTLPVYSRNAEKQAATEEKLMLSAENDQQLNEMVANAKADYSKAVALSCQLEMLGSAVEAQNSIRLLKLALKGGEISLLEYIQEMSYFVSAAKEYNTACTEYALVMAALAQYSVAQ